MKEAAQSITHAHTHNGFMWDIKRTESPQFKFYVTTSMVSNTRTVLGYAKFFFAMEKLRAGCNF